jgi:ferredoxin
MVIVRHESEGLDSTFEYPHNIYIIEIAEDKGLDLPYSCRAGAYTTCAAKLVSRTVTQGDQSFLNVRQIKAGYILLYIAIPMSHYIIKTHKDELH